MRRPNWGPLDLSVRRGSSPTTACPRVGARRIRFPRLLGCPVNYSSTQEQPGGSEGERNDWLARVRGWDWETIGLVLGIKALLLTFGVQAVASFDPVHRSWLEI